MDEPTYKRRLTCSYCQEQRCSRLSFSFIGGPEGGIENVGVATKRQGGQN